MLDAIAAILPLAVGAALSPLPIVAIVLLLMSGGRASGVAFLIARFVVVLALVGVFSFLAESIELAQETSPIMAILRILVGLALAVLAVRKLRGRAGSDEDPELPGWMVRIEGASVGKSIRLAALVSLANPKELLFGIGAGLTIGAAELPYGETAAVVVIYAVIACVSAAVPVVLALVAPRRAEIALTAFRGWLIRNTATVTAVVLLVIAAVLIGGGLSEL